jgi:hypothetical protein
MKKYQILDKIYLRNEASSKENNDKISQPESRSPTISTEATSGKKKND